ncbi:O-antigen ligase family protein [Thiohalorhabdus sp.]|uniref:O-antigen ligase family protein n=1 Tax=Thiohalorhabdus sp. TaxID=3094134 RepID=UPI002FC367F4
MQRTAAVLSSRFPLREGQSFHTVMVSAGVALLGFGSLLSTASIYLALGLLAVLAASEGRPFLRFCARSPWAWLVVGLTVYMALRLLIAQQALPDQADAISKHGRQLAMVAGLPALFLAWHLGRDPKRVILLLTGLVGSLTVFFFLEAGWSALSHYLVEGGGGRLQFGGHKNAIGGLYGGGEIAALYLVTVLVKQLRQHRWGWAGIALLVLLVGMAALFFLVVIWNQSRTAWLGLVLALVPVALYALGRFHRAERVSREAGVITAVVLLLAVLAWNYSATLEKRAAGLVDGFRGASELQLDDAATGSVEYRVRLLMAGWEALGEKPLSGWGPGRFDFVIAEVGGGNLRDLNHFHNFYIQMAVGFGMIGLVGFLAVFLLPLRDTWCLFRERSLSPHFTLLVIATWVYLLTLNGATIRHDDPVGQAYFVMALGIAGVASVKRRGEIAGEGAEA